MSQGPAELKARLGALLEREGLRPAGDWYGCFETLPEDRRSFHAALIRLLAHLDFEEREAEAHWKAVCHHRHELTRRLGRDAGIAVALLDYFLNLRRLLRNPTVVELGSFEATERSAVTDGLTGLFNRRYLGSSLTREIQRSHRYGLGCALVMLDVDGFKTVNDRHGHVVGDDVLVAVSGVIRQNLRAIDVPCRYGGDELAVLLAGTGRNGAFVVADRIRYQVKLLFTEGSESSSFRVTLSGGIAVYPHDAPYGEVLLQRADDALYRAKHAGGDRIALWRGENGPETPPG